MSRLKRVLLVNCYFDDLREAIPRVAKMPKPMGPAYLAGAFSSRQCELRLYDEMSSGPLLDKALLGWPDMLVLTGLTTSFDRMLHLTAYARTLNPKVIVAAGGPAIRALPRLSQRFFDYSCQGDVEEMQDVIVDVFGRDYVSEDFFPRYDLAYWMGWCAEVESSRYCNFRCSFCTLTGEGRPYRKHDLDYIRRQILAVAPRKYLLFIDNNFYGNDRDFFRARMDLLRDLWRSGQFLGWAAPVTNDFFFEDKNLELAREAGCIALFCGVESFDSDWLRKMNKFQNTCIDPIEMIRKCLEAGIVFSYGMMLDVTARPISDLYRELEYVIDRPEITLPGLLTAPIPLPRTPYFYQCLSEGLLLPQVKIRDLEGATLSLRPFDPEDRVVRFLGKIGNFRSYWRRVLRHGWDFWRRYRRVLSSKQMQIALAHSALLCATSLVTSPQKLAGRGWRRTPRTYISTTEDAGPLYRPAFPVASQYESYFQPTMLTDQKGNLAEAVYEDLAEKPSPPKQIGLRTISKQDFEVGMKAVSLRPE